MGELQLISDMQHPERTTPSISYLKLPGFVSSEDVQAMLKRSQELLAEFDITNHPMVPDYLCIHPFRSPTYQCQSSDQVHNRREILARGR